MPLKRFNDAIESARTAYAAGDEEAFIGAITDAQRTVQAHPTLF